MAEVAAASGVACAPPREDVVVDGLEVTGRPACVRRMGRRDLVTRCLATLGALALGQWPHRATARQGSPPRRSESERRPRRPRLARGLRLTRTPTGHAHLVTEEGATPS
jgi:hypothetical protein